MTARLDRYSDFWPHYLRAHRRAGTRALHYLGSGGGLLLLALGLITLDWRIVVAAPLFGYACAWLGHATIEGNRPATFGHPVWSFFSDFRMLGLFLTGRLATELERAEAAQD
ncbi:MAG: Mpo1-like protein [Kiloniellales bacterium]